MLRVNSLYYEYFDFSCNPMESPVITQTIMECAKKQDDIKTEYSFLNEENKTQKVFLKMEYLQKWGEKHIIMGIHEFEN